MKQPDYIIGTENDVRKRIERANVLLFTIGSTGRNFFRSNEGRTAQFRLLDVDGQAIVAYHDERSGKPMVPSTRGQFHGCLRRKYPYLTQAFREMARNFQSGFSHGSTLNGLVQTLHHHILTGVTIPYTNGETGRGPASLVWGYQKEDCCSINAMAEELELTTPRAQVEKALAVTRGDQDRPDYSIEVAGLHGDYLVMLRTQDGAVLLNDDNARLERALQRADDLRALYEARAHENRPAAPDVQPAGPRP